MRAAIWALIKTPTAPGNVVSPELSAEALGISPRTVEIHRQAILSKLNARNMVEAVGLIAEIERQLRAVTPES